MPQRFLATVLVATTGWLLFSACTCFAQSQADIIAEAEKSVLKIEIVDSGLGSGFVVDASGIAVTNLHVIAGAKDDQVIAKFPNGQQCKVIGTYWVDEGRDIAIIQLDRSSLTPVRLAEELPRKGDEVLALGSPMGLSFTATRGIVSAIRGEQEMQLETGDNTFRGTWVQVDASLSPGNSGGPLINLKGEVVAMSTRASLSATVQNLNFGISVTDIREILESAKGNSLATLSESVEHIVMSGPKQKPKERSFALELQPTEVSDDAIREYIEEIEKEYSVLVRMLKREIEEKKSDLRSHRRVPSYMPSMMNEMFANMESEIRELQQIARLTGTKPTPEAIFALATTYGPQFRPREHGTIGVLTGSKSWSTFGKNHIFVEHRGNEYILPKKGATKFSTFGRDLVSGPMAIAGTVKLKGEGKTVELLVPLDKERVRTIIFGNSSSANIFANSESSEFRTWKDKTGRFQVEARMIQVSNQEVTLEKTDGKTIRVPLDKLSTIDRNYINSQ